MAAVKEQLEVEHAAAQGASLASEIQKLRSYPAGAYIRTDIREPSEFTHHWTNMGMTTWM